MAKLTFTVPSVLNKGGGEKKIEISAGTLTEAFTKISQEMGCNYCDVRAENSFTDGISIENGQIEYSNLYRDSGIGIRVLNSGAWGFYSISNPNSKESVRRAVENAIKNSHSTKKNKIKLIESPTYEDSIDFPTLIKPDLEELVKIGFDCDKRIRKNKRIIKSQVNLSYKINSKYLQQTSIQRQ